MPIAISPPTTDIEIISQACSLVGKSSFNTIDAGGPFAKDGAAFYGTLVSAELGSNRWRFALHEEPMAIITTLDPQVYGYQYYWEMPADLGMLVSVQLSNSRGGLNDWQVFGNRVLLNSNQSQVAIFSLNPPVSKWPPAFALYMIYALADMLATSVTNSDRMVARIQAKLNEWRSRALFADGQNSPVRSMRSRPWINARYAFRTQNGGGNG